MKIFVSYSFRPENAWVEDLLIPLIRHFGHEVVTGTLLDAGALDEEVKRKIRQCRRVICIVTRARPRYDPAATVPSSYEPPDWVRDELMIARGGGKLAIEFRESQVEYSGAAPFHAFRMFDRDRLPKLMLDVAETLAQWPTGPIELRLSFPDEMREEIERAATAGNLRAQCTATEDGEEVASEEVPVHVREGQLIVLFWIKPRPNYSIDVEVPFGVRRLARRGISPLVREAALR